MALFLPLADTLSQAGYEVVLLQLPGFPIPPELQNIVINPNPAPVRRWGFSFLETIVLLHQTLQSLKDDRHETVLVAHDWGALVAYLLLSKFTPDQAGISRLVTLDVGLRKEIPARMGLLILLYQGYLNLAWMLPDFLGNAMTRGLAFLLGTPDAHCVSAAMNVYYRELWKMLARGGEAGLKLVPPKSVPWLFAYGARTPEWARFSNEAFLRTVKSTDAISEVHSFKGGHWFFREDEGPVEFPKMLMEWLNIPHQG